MKKISFILIFIGLIFMIPFIKPQADEGDMFQLPGVEVTWNYTFDGYWYDYRDIYGFYEWEADNDHAVNYGVTQIDFSSEISQYYEKIEFVYNDKNLSYPITSASTIYISSLNQVGIDDWEIQIEYGFVQDTIYVVSSGVKIRIHDSRYNPEGFSYDLGYKQGKTDGRKEYIDTELPDIITSNYESGYQNAFNDYYISRYNQGLADADGNVKSITQYIPGILGIVLGFFLQLASISFAGVSILDVIVAMFAVTIALLIFKIILGGK